MWLERLFGICVVNFFVLSTNVVVGSGDKENAYLLPGNIIPIHYDLRFNTHMTEYIFDPDFAEKKYYFDGTVNILMVPVEDNVARIVLNSYKTVNVTNAVLTVKGSQSVNLGKGVFNSTSQKIHYDLKTPLVKNQEVLLNITFTSLYNKHDQAFFRAHYDVDNDIGIALVTQFQATFARWAFPCFDEPKYKAKFTISVSVPTKVIERGYKVFSNTHEERVTKSDGYHIYQFKTTPLPISTYLIAVVVADVKSSPVKLFHSPYPDPAEKSEKELRTWGQKAYINQSDFAQKSALALLNLYKNDFKIGYGYEKIDQMALDTSVFGMENWGLILYTECIISLIDFQKVDAAILIAHELSHQWFGNLVTCHSWSDIWLNEGFATYFEFFGANKIELPGENVTSWNLPFQYVVEVVQSAALEEDIYDYTHALTVDASNPNLANCYFDEIEYEKAGSVIRMWNHVLGDKSFMKVLQTHLKKNKEGLSTPKGLLSVFDMVANESVSQLPQGELPSNIFECWRTEKGYPLVQLKRNEEQPMYIILTQKVFRYRDDGENVTAKWNIPISFSTSTELKFHDTRASHWIRASETKLNISVNFFEWIVINNQQTGYYRVNYPIPNWRALLQLLLDPKKKDIIHEMNRAQIIDDAAHLVRSTAENYLPYGLFMDITTYLEHEDDYYPWKTAVNNFKYLARMLSKNKEAYSLFKKHIRRITRKQYEALTPSDRPEDTYQDKKLRAELFSLTCAVYNTACLEIANSVVKRHINGSSSIAGYLLAPAYCSAVRSSDDSLWNEIWQMYLNSKNATEKELLISALSCTKNEELLMKLLIRSIARTGVNQKERQIIFSSIYNGSPENVNLLFDFVSSNLERVYDSYGGPKHFGDILVKLAKGLATDNELSRMGDLLRSIHSKEDRVYICKNSERKIVEIVKTNNDWLKQRYGELFNWLASNYGSA